MQTKQLTRPRIARLFKTCGASPLMLSRAADKVWKLAERTGSQALRDLSDALHEQRHVAMQLHLGNTAEAAKHSQVVGWCIDRALRA